MSRRFRNQGVELDGDSKPPRADFGSLCPFPASPTPSPAAPPPVPRSEVVRVPPRTSRIACGAASAPATLSGPSERTSPGDCGSFRLAAAPSSALGHRSPPPADRTSGRCAAPGTGGGDRPCPGEQRMGVTSSGQALPCP
ncbi:hypothetical protein J1605_015163 [Eschrichtius robustus]|uniref:Uncharacterized protein n=1 Tax=Eschrichtius robustus TaxID=9764 RepID=A0AB34GAR1_ESCRO|nr:hypothetical protein J1605_015163 [Eschrichtius robustus]